MNRTPLFLSLSAAALLLTACPPVEPPIVHREGSSLRAGAWALDVYDVDLAGRCGDLDPRDMLRADDVPMLVGAPGSRGEDMVRAGEVRILLEGLPLDGYFDGFLLDADGFMSVAEPGAPTEPVPEEEPRSGDDECADPGCDGEEDAPPPPGEVDVDELASESSRPEGPGIEASLSARIYEPAWFEGRLDLHYQTQQLDCDVTAWFDAAFVGADGGGHPPAEGDVGEPAPGEGEDRDDGEHHDEDRD